MFILRIAALGIGLALQSQAAVAASDAEFKDWRVICRDDGALGGCQMVQSQTASIDEADVFLLSINKGEQANTASAVVSVPMRYVTNPVATRASS